MDLFCSHGVGQTVELCNFCSHGGGQTVELWNCSVVMVVDSLWNCPLAAHDVVHVIVSDFIF